jgi:DNA polymerase-4
MRIRLIGVRFSGLVRGTYQINIFEDTVEMMALYQAMDKIKTRFGFDAVTRCAGTLLKSKTPQPKDENPLKGEFYYKSL